MCGAFFYLDVSKNAQFYLAVRHIWRCANFKLIDLRDLNSGMRQISQEYQREPHQLQGGGTFRLHT